MTVRTLLKATDARFQSLKISPLPPLITCRIHYPDVDLYEASKLKKWYSDQP